MNRACTSLFHLSSSSLSPSSSSSSSSSTFCFPFPFPLLFLPSFPGDPPCLCLSRCSLWLSSTTENDSNQSYTLIHFPLSKYRLKRILLSGISHNAGEVRSSLSSLSPFE